MIPGGSGGTSGARGDVKAHDRNGRKEVASRAGAGRESTRGQRQPQHGISGQVATKRSMGGRAVIPQVAG